MEKSQEKILEIEKVGEDLFNFVVVREDIKDLMSRLPLEADIKRETVEYELQILKIISAGWSISYFLEKDPRKDPLAQVYWKAVYQYSVTVSETTSLMTGQEIDYFKILQERLEAYIAAMKKIPEAREPAAVIGPEFARTCGNVDDIFSIMTGSRMFKETIGSVKAYFESLGMVCNS